MAGSRHNGTSFVSIATTRKRWNGSAFVDLVTAKRWTGAVWVDLFPAGPGPGPGFPTGEWISGSSASDSYACHYDGSGTNPCSLLHTFTIVKTFSTTGSPTVTGKPVAGVSYSIGVGTVTFTVSVARGTFAEEYIPTLLLTNGSGTTELPFSWVLTYSYTADAPPDPPGGGHGGDVLQ